MNKCKFKERGITLVALVVTIIVLLILAGISIQAITNTGLFANAKLAKEKSIEGQLKEEITLAMESYNPVESIHSSAYNKDGDEICILDRLSTNIDEETQIVNKISIKQLIEGLEDREKQIILLRYYKSRTQSQVAKILGITQVQVSRLEKQILETMKKKICK